MPKKTGRPLEDPPAVIQLLVNLLAAQSEIGDRGATKRAAIQLGLKGQPKTHVERLRKRLARMRAAGELPAAETPIDQKVREIRAEYAQRDAALARIRADLLVKEQEAVALGLDISAPDLSPLLKTLEREKENLDLIVHARPSFAGALLMEQHLSADEAEARFREAAQRHAQVKREIEILRVIRDHRQVLGPAARVFTQD